MVETASLEKMYGRKVIGGSNPPSSAKTSKFIYLLEDENAGTILHQQM